MWKPTVAACDTYMDERQGKYEYRAIRYRNVIDWMLLVGLQNGMTVVDIGAGMTEFAFCMMNEYGLKVRYIPVDGGIDGTDLNVWTPGRAAHFYVAIEILEHLVHPYVFTQGLQEAATVGVAFTTPDPATTDVLAMDPTHVSPIDSNAMRGLGFTVESRLHYGGVYSDGKNDSLLGTWRK